MVIYTAYTVLVKSTIDKYYIYLTLELPYHFAVITAMS